MISLQRYINCFKKNKFFFASVTISKSIFLPIEEIAIKEYEVLHDALQTAAAARHIDLTDYRDPQARTIQRLRTNLVTFVAFKNYKRSQDMIRALTDDQGKIRSFAVFQREAIALGETYHRHELEAEYATVVAAAQAAAQWDDFVRDADIFPYLIYKTQDDNKVRKSHQLLHDVCKPVMDVFWDTWYPPNGWRCRCYVLQARTDAGYKTEPDAYPTDKETPLVFKHNPAKSGKVWNKQHPYFKDLDKDIKDKITTTKSNLLNNIRLFDIIDGIDVHYSNYGNDNFDNEFKMAKILKLEFNNAPIQMLHQIEIKGLKIPDYKTGDTLIEYKDIKSKNMDTINDHIIKATSQLVVNRYSKNTKRRIVVFNLQNTVDTHEVINNFKNTHLAKEYNMELWIYQNGSFIKNKTTSE
jgi:SPP1 gp7 family putative phage head morphogenesis protein